MEKNVQYKFNDSFKCIEEEMVVDFYKSYDAAPEYIKDFINSSEYNTFVLKYNNNYYCPVCLNKLKRFKCSKCNKVIHYRRRYNVNINELKKLSSDEDFYIQNRYCYFDIKDNNILLYTFLEEKHYKDESCLIPYRIKHVTLDKVFLIKDKEIIELINNKKYLYEDIDEYLNVLEIRDSIMKYLDTDLLDIKLNSDDKRILNDIYYDLFFNNDYILYNKNLDELKNIKEYKYSNIWKLKDIDSYVSILSLSMYPLYYKQFELLMKLGLYRLALFCPFVINNGKTFKERFGVDKKYLDFMVKNNVDYDGLECLRMYPTESTRIYVFLKVYNIYLKNIKEYINIEKLVNYIDDNKINFYDYYDYILECKNQKYNLKDKSVLYPNDFIYEHDKVFAELLVLKDENINEKIKSLSKIYGMNIYEDKKYIIFPASSIESLIDESRDMSNCVKNYCTRISEKETQIYFMREKSNISKSLVTIEVNNNKVVQARSKYNKDVSKRQKKIIDKFEKNLIPIRII